MSAVAEVTSATTLKSDPRGCDLPTCPVCADSMVAAEASAYVSDNVISYLWTCDTCGYGFVTKHALRRFAATEHSWNSSGFGTLAGRDVPLSRGVSRAFTELRKRSP